jgi:alpha-L-fucosidase
VTGPEDPTSWFTDARFGMFIHWGLYASGARHEWVQTNEQIPAAEYAARYQDRFDPDLYDPDSWATAAADAGMRYLIVTAKHHEGFCLWDSALTDFTATHTPAGRDLLRPMLDAFRGRGLRTGVYYSLLDWHHPDYSIDTVHPLRNRPDRLRLNQSRDMDRYRAYLHGQVSELLTEYGDIDVFWPDFSVPIDMPGVARNHTMEQARAIARYLGDDPETIEFKWGPDWDADGLLRMIQRLQPSILVNDRLGLADGYDFVTPEQQLPDELPTRDGRPVPWEICQTFSGSWGYHRDESSWKSVEELVALLATTVSGGGNLLLNVGPTARGEFDSRALDRLAGIGDWMRRHARSIHGCGRAPEDIRAALDESPLHHTTVVTYSAADHRAYLHLVQWPSGPLVLRRLAHRVRYVQLLNDASEILAAPAAERAAAGAGPDDVVLTLPTRRPDVAIPVLELFLG